MNKIFLTQLSNLEKIDKNKVISIPKEDVEELITHLRTLDLNSHDLDFENKLNKEEIIEISLKEKTDSKKTDSEERESPKNKRVTESEKITEIQFKDNFDKFSPDSQIIQFIDYKKSSLKDLILKQTQYTINELKFTNLIKKFIKKNNQNYSLIDPKKELVNQTNFIFKVIKKYLNSFITLNNQEINEEFFNHCVKLEKKINDITFYDFETKQFIESLIKNILNVKSIKSKKEFYCYEELLIYLLNTNFNNFIFYKEIIAFIFKGQEISNLEFELLKYLQNNQTARETKIVKGTKANTNSQKVSKNEKVKKDKNNEIEREITINKPYKYLFIVTEDLESKREFYLKSYKNLNKYLRRELQCSFIGETKQELNIINILNSKENINWDSEATISDNLQLLISNDNSISEQFINTKSKEYKIPIDNFIYNQSNTLLITSKNKYYFDKEKSLVFNYKFTYLGLFLENLIKELDFYNYSVKELILEIIINKKEDHFIYFNSEIKSNNLELLNKNKKDSNEDESIQPLPNIYSEVNNPIIISKNDILQILHTLDLDLKNSKIVEVLNNRDGIKIVDREILTKFINRDSFENKNFSNDLESKSSDSLENNTLVENNSQNNNSENSSTQFTLFLKNSKIIYFYPKSLSLLEHNLDWCNQEITNKKELNIYIN